MDLDLEWLTYKDGCGDGGNVDELLHLVLVGVPLVVEAGHVGAHVVARVVVVAVVVLGGVGLAVLLLHPAAVLVHDPVVVGLGPGAVTPESSPSSPGGHLIKHSFYLKPGNVHRELISTSFLGLHSRAEQWDIKVVMGSL